MIDTIPTPRRGYREAGFHAIGRLVTRYGIRLTMPEYVTLCQHLAAGLIPYTTAHHHGPRRVVKFNLHGRNVFAVWEPRNGVIITFLDRFYAPPRMGERSPRKPKGGAKHWRYKWMD